MPTTSHTAPTTSGRPLARCPAPRAHAGLGAAALAATTLLLPTWAQAVRMATLWSFHAWVSAMGKWLG